MNEVLAPSFKIGVLIEWRNKLVHKNVAPRFKHSKLMEALSRTKVSGSWLDLAKIDASRIKR